MNFTINREILENTVSNIKRGLSNKTTQPILKGIKITVENDKITLISSSANISVKSVITEGINVKETGKFIVPGKYFTEIISKVSSKEINIVNNDGNTISIIAGKSNFNLNGMDINDYPEIDFNKNDNPVEIPTLRFKDLIKQTSFSASSQGNRPILTGINFILSKDSLTCVATDSYRLSKKESTLTSNMERQFVIPATSVIELTRILEKSDATLKMHPLDTSVLFEYENTLFKIVLLEGNYPETSRLIPSDFPIIVKFNKEELVTAIEHASLISTREANKNYIKLTLRPDLIVEITSSNSEIGRVLEEVNPIDKVKGGPLKISFSSKYILDALKELNSSEVSLNFTGEIRPFTITGDMDENAVQLILPVRAE